jgi:hypothetical protein
LLVGKNAPADVLPLILICVEFRHEIDLVHLHALNQTE